MFEDSDLAFYLAWQSWRRHFISDEDDEPELTESEAATIRHAVDATARFNHRTPTIWEAELMRLRGVEGQSVAIIRFDLAYPPGG